MNPPAPAVDINSDLGEGFGSWRRGDDLAMLDIVSSANVACGFHAGDPMTMVQTCRAAVRRTVTVGAHVGYRDLVGFGRRFIDMTYDQLVPELLYQLGALDAVVRSVGGRVAYVKPHGALYHALERHPSQAAALIATVGLFDASLPVVGLAGSGWLEAAKDAGLNTVSEAFADRAYAPDGSLVPRGVPGAVLTDPDEIANRCVDMVQLGRVQTTAGNVIELDVDSICVHGDTPGAVKIAATVAKVLSDQGVTVRAFSRA
ncbi:LamB/YcsF family protein [Pedococcus sp. P5_B7]